MGHVWNYYPFYFYKQFLPGEKNRQQFYPRGNLSFASFPRKGAVRLYSSLVDGVSGCVSSTPGYELRGRKGNKRQSVSSCLIELPRKLSSCDGNRTAAEGFAVAGTGQGFIGSGNFLRYLFLFKSSFCLLVVIRNFYRIFNFYKKKSIGFVFVSETKSLHTFKVK